MSWCPIDVRLVDIQITRNQFPELNGLYVNCLGRTPTCELVGPSAEETNLENVIFQDSKSFYKNYEVNFSDGRKCLRV